MVERGRAEVTAAGAGNVVVREELAQNSGLPAGSFDTAVVRLVLIPNGGREQEIVDHAASLVHPGGRVLLYDLDSIMIRVVPPTAPVSELHERFQAYQRARGNDPAVGLRLPELLESAGLVLEAALSDRVPLSDVSSTARATVTSGYRGCEAVGSRWNRTA